MFLRADLPSEGRWLVICVALGQEPGPASVHLGLGYTAASNSIHSFLPSFHDISSHNALALEESAL